MSATIWKYELDITDVQRVRMPLGARLLSVQVQHHEKWTGDLVGRWEAVTLWAHVDPSAKEVERYIAIVGTGNPAPDLDDDGSVYVGTVQCGSFVWHVFDGGENHAL